MQQVSVLPRVMNSVLLTSGKQIAGTGPRDEANFRGDLLSYGPCGQRPEQIAIDGVNAERARHEWK